MITNISDRLNTIPAIEPVYKEDPAYLAIMTLYVVHLHQSVMNAWKQFSETTKKISKDSDADHKAGELRHAELEGQRRHTEYLAQGREAEIVRCGIHHQTPSYRHLLTVI